MESLENNFLVTFFQLFDAKIEIEETNNDFFLGIVRWEQEEDTQKVKWYRTLSPSEMKLLVDLFTFLKSNSLVLLDKISISNDRLFKFLIKNGWDDESSKRSIELLSKVEVRMIDDNEETDSFFIHF